MASETTASASNLDQIADPQTEGYYLSKKFCCPNADVVFQSIDKVRFYVYKKDLATFSGGFPPAEMISDPKEIVDMPEGGAVLDMLFSFARPGRYPTLHTLDLEVLLELADAAEKYEVYSAVMACSIWMRTNLTKYPLEVCRYAGRYHYPDLMDDVAPLLLDVPLFEIFDLEMSQQYFRAWLRHLAQFQSLHERLFDSVIRLSACVTCKRYLAHRLGTHMPSKTLLVEVTGMICRACSTQTGVWIPHEDDDETSTWFPLSGVDRIYQDFKKFSDFL